MSCVPHRAGYALILTCIASFMLAGCGKSKDKGGFTSKDRQAAAVAMKAFAYTGVQQATETYTDEIGQPTTCRIRLESRPAKRYRLYLQWTPKPHSSYGYAWLEAVTSNGVIEPSSLHTETVASERLASAHVGDALTPPSEPCHIGIDGSIIPVKAK